MSRGWDEMRWTYRNHEFLSFRSGFRIFLKARFQQVWNSMALFPKLLIASGIPKPVDHHFPQQIYTGPSCITRMAINRRKSKNLRNSETEPGLEWLRTGALMGAQIRLLCLPIIRIWFKWLQHSQSLPGLLLSPLSKGHCGRTVHPFLPLALGLGCLFRLMS